MGPALRPARDPHHGDLVRGRFQPVQRGVAPGGESGAARLTAKGLDPLGLTMLAVPDQGVDSSVSVAKVAALLVGTGEAIGVDAFRGSPPAFDLAPGAHKHWGRHSSRQGRGSESTGVAILGSAGLQQTGEPAALGHTFWGGRLKREPVQTPEQHQQVEKADHEQEHELEQMKRHQNPRYLKWVAGRSSL